MKSSWRILLLAALALWSSGASATDQQRLADLGTCLAFSYVNAGLDGQKDVPPDLVPGILAIKAEFMFEASLAGLDDNAAQTVVVEKLTEQNMLAHTKGIAAVKGMYLPLCRQVAQSLEAKDQRVQ